MKSDEWNLWNYVQLIKPHAEFICKETTPTLGY